MDDSLNAELPGRPVMIFDGDCGFCRKWVAMWREGCGDAVEFVAFQDLNGRFPEIPAADFDRSVQWVDVDGKRSEKAEAVLRCMVAGNSMVGRAALAAFLHAPGVAFLLNAAYQCVASRRMAFSRLTTMLWGDDVRTPTYHVANSIFLRLIGVIYLIAFLSFWNQSAGLVGTNGILPAQEFFSRIFDAVGSRGYSLVPSLLWIDASDGMLVALCVAGCLMAVGVVIGVFPIFCLTGLWVCYLSLVSGGQDFYAFQWDNLLLEVGFLSIFLAPWSIRPKWNLGNPRRLARFLMWWLLFRFMVASGVVKLASGDEAWSDLSALKFHFFTQPIPNPVAWWMQQLPEGLLMVLTAGMFAVELALPMLIFMPRNLRLIAAVGLFVFQLSVFVTGNYGYFNILSAALVILLLDDVVWGGRLKSWFSRGTSPTGWPRWLLWPVATICLVLSCVPFWSSFRLPLPAAFSPLVSIYQSIAPFRTINGYGLFAVMTTTRLEIIIQGSLDGVTWEVLPFKFKPGALDRMPPQVAPYMPRLDWQMWFAALGRAEQNPWLLAFLRKVLEADPAVLALMESDPFDGKRPVAVRAMLDDYRFTTPEERRASGNWWTAEPVAIYLPAITLENFRPSSESSW